ncbi:hypothetical protein LWI28_019506 [Acer negundo]|uniref:Retrotransposon gag domain-containing protein n=1 Tax=Acer negundo TaxID=4023 RepID=A0AAD5J098_ACENE|nr:hypothetical protein LWI28_019506 [Acer negundo]
MNVVLHRLDMMDERINRKSGRVSRSGRHSLRRREGIGDSDEDEEEVQMGGVKLRIDRFAQRQPRGSDVRGNVLDEITKRMKVEVSDFLGKLDPDAFYDWITTLEDYFNWFSVPEERRVRFVKLKLKGSACAWWSSVEERLKRTRQVPITEWEEMKEKLEMKYLPINYEQLIYEDLLQWSLGTKLSVDQYIERFHELTVRSKVNESEVQLLARYLKGLKPDIRKEMLTARLYNVEEAYQMALQVERQSSGNSRRLYSTDSGNFRFPTAASSKTSEDPAKGNTGSHWKGKAKVHGERPQCYKSKGFGHFAVVCPTRDQRIAYVCEKDLMFDDEQSIAQEINDQEQIEPEEERLQATDLPLCVIQYVLTEFNGECNLSTPESITTTRVPDVPTRSDTVLAIRDHQFMSTRRGGYYKFLIQWAHKPLSESVWLQGDEVSHLSPLLFQAYLQQNLPKASSLGRRQTDALQ